MSKSVTGANHRGMSVGDSSDPVIPPAAMLEAAAKAAFDVMAQRFAAENPEAAARTWDTLETDTDDVPAEMLRATMRAAVGAVIGAIRPDILTMDGRVKVAMFQAFMSDDPADIDRSLASACTRAVTAYLDTICPREAV